ncbi:MAG TPA: heliorhodopsin HeR [Acidimicrobiales bacterium]|nr:heliorhodopsin HeR [Acidimicrobiales bacterium]
MAASPLARLRRLNLAAGALHLVSAAAIVALANGFSLPVTANYMAGQPGSDRYQLVTLANIPMSLWIAVFFVLSALAHFTVAQWRWPQYQRRLAAQQNPYRWLEYALSSSVMIVAIAQLTGISDVAALVALVGANAAMIGFGWMQERYEAPGGSLQPFWLGCLVGAVPWIAVGIYLFAPGASQHAPGFVYGIYFTIFAFFNCFALVQWLQYKRIGRFADYLVGERTYVILSFVAKSLLAWQIFAAVLAGSATS